MNESGEVDVKVVKSGEISLGFEEENKLKVFLGKIKRNILRLGKETRFSGVFSNIWVWNLVFLHLTLSVVLLVLILKFYNSLPTYIGINIDDIEKLDTLINKQYLYIIVIFHIVLAVTPFLFGLKSGKKLTHLLVISFIYFCVLGVFEFIGLRNLLIYFNA